MDSFIETILVLHGDRSRFEQDDLHDYYWPTTGKWSMRGKFEDHLNAPLHSDRCA